MTGTPLASRRHAVIFGNTNSGKSALFNAILGQDLAIVSEQKGTTTDPVVKAMELLPYGPIALVDTAGFKDEDILGSLRMKKTGAMLRRADLALYAADAGDFDRAAFAEAQERFQKHKLPYVLVFTKADTVSREQLDGLRQQYPQAEITSAGDQASIDALKARMNTELTKLGTLDEETILGDLLPQGATVIMVVPVDSEAPKGRLILPQVQLIRDCLDHGFQCVVARDTELADAIANTQKADLVVTDSQAFAEVSRIVPEELPLTSFSMLLARQKGDLRELVRGADAVHRLKDGARILIAEGCTHNHTHEDIGRVKIPRLLQKKTGKKFTIDYYAGYDFPDNLESYDLVIHCGGCMLTRKAILSRIEQVREESLPITNYGVLLASLNGILERSLTIFRNNSLLDE
jgi:[FeFe] hydrogenase H-cluster maturation GTPase HydF